MNKVILIGRLTQDPEVRYTQNGKAVATFSIAVNRFVSQGNQAVDFIPIVAWEKLAEICGNNLSKGRRIMVEGRLQIRTYDAQDGTKRRVSEVIAQNIEFLDSSSQGGNEPKSDGDPSQFGSDVFPQEEIPF